MEEILVKTGRTKATIENEIRSLDQLITRREAWLNKAENKLRGTYKAVNLDTQEMEKKLTALRDELKEVENSTNN